MNFIVPQSRSAASFHSWCISSVSAPRWRRRLSSRTSLPSTSWPSSPAAGPWGERSSLAAAAAQTRGSASPRRSASAADAPSSDFPPPCRQQDRNYLCNVITSFKWQKLIQTSMAARFGRHGMPSPAFNRESWPLIVWHWNWYASRI